MDYEGQFLSKILLERNLTEALDLRVSEEFFETGGSLWEYILTIYRKHGDVPPIDLVKKNFPDFAVEDTTAPLSLLVDELRKRWAFNVLKKSMKTQAEFLNDRNPYAALDEMRSALMRADMEVRPSRDVNIVEETGRRVQKYQEIVDGGGIIGIPTPWDCLNEVTQGFSAEELIMLAGRGGSGKTWCEVVLATHNWRNGYKPLLFTREMSVEKIVRRIDATCARLPYQRFRSGQLTSQELDRWKEVLTTMEGSAPFWVTGDDDGRLGVSGVAAKIQRYRPDIVYIDGGYLLEDDRGAKASWERWSNVCRDLQRLAKLEGLPIVLSHQFNLSGKGTDGNADTLKYGDVQMWFDLIIGLYRTEAMEDDKEMLFRINKQREGLRLEWITDWDLDDMKFEVKSSDSDSARANDSQNEEFRDEEVSY